jgi:hypothetical protein
MNRTSHSVCAHSSPALFVLRSEQTEQYGQKSNCSGLDGFPHRLSHYQDLFLAKLRFDLSDFRHRAFALFQSQFDQFVY